MTRFESFTVQDATFRRIRSEQGEVIRKETRLHRILQTHWSDIARWIASYAHSISAAGIPVPKVVATAASHEGIVYQCEYLGPNLVQILDGEPLESLVTKESLLNQVFGILDKVRQAGLNLDPHIKNFVTRDEAVSYVDFTPPWVDDYHELRLSVASPAEREILIPFFQCMRPENLGYHFAADLLKMSETCREILPELYRKLLTRNLVEGNYESFMERVLWIKDSELRREREGVFLL